MIRRLEQALAERDAKLAERDAALVLALARSAELEARIAELEAKLSENSSNSSKPPSTDPPGKLKRRRKKKSGRKRGGQKGHKGSYRALLPGSHIDELVELFPAHCECGAALPRVPDHAPHRFQQTELLVPVRVYLTEWRRHRVTCPACGHKTRATASHPKTAFGPRLTAAVVALTGVYHLSRRKTVGLMGELFGVRISLGAVSALEKRMSEALEPAFNEVVEQVDAAPIKHADGTSWKRSGILIALWTVTTGAATIFKVVEDNSARTVRRLFGKLRGILVSDRATAFGFWSMDQRQICWAHLLRKFISFSERDGPVGSQGQELLEHARLVFAYWAEFRDGRRSRKSLRSIMAPVRASFEKLLERIVDANVKGISGSCTNILAHREALWTFVDLAGVEPTNNNAERELRAFVLWRKGSFGTQSERGDRFAERIMTVVHTARKQHIGVLEFLTASLRGNARSLFA